MKKDLKAISLLICLLFLISFVSSCAKEENILEGLPEISKNETVYYNSAVIKHGENLNEARPCEECHYTQTPSYEQAVADGAVITWTDGKEYITENWSAAERFVKNVNHGVDDSLLFMEINELNERTSTKFFFYKDKRLYLVTEPYTEVTVIGEDDVKLITSKNNGKGGIECSYKIKDVFDGSVCRYVYSTITKLDGESKVYDEKLTQRYFDVAGIHEGDTGEAKLYTEYPFKEKFPTAKEIFELGGMVVFDTEGAIKVYNLSALDRFYENVNSGVPDTLFVYTDSEKPAAVMYSFTGESIICAEDMRKEEEAKGLFVSELFGKVNICRDTEEIERLNKKEVSFQKEYESYKITAEHIRSDETSIIMGNDWWGITSGNTVKIPNITYVTKYITAQKYAESYK